MDSIFIKGLKVFAYHGCNDEEKQNGQNFYIDSDIHMDMSKAAATDNLNSTVNYAKICKFINKYLTENRFDLIEAAAFSTAEALLIEFPRIKAVNLTMHKPEAPLSVSFDDVGVNVSKKWNRAYLGIGSNMGDKKEYLMGAVDAFYDDEKCKVVSVSKFIETKPYGPVKQDDFLNGCIALDTLYTPMELLDRIHQIETSAGRVRDIHWGPRTLDIDILLYNDEVIDEKDLLIPHPQMHKRDFVLRPLSQIAKYAVHPIFKKTVQQMFEDNLENMPSCGGCSGCMAR